METVSWFFNVLTVGGFGMGIGTALGMIVAQRAHVQSAIREMRDERKALREQMEGLAKLHNGFVATQQSMDVRLSDIETKTSVLWQGFAKK